MGSSTGNRKDSIQVARLASGRKAAPAPICAWHDALWVMSCGEPARDAGTDLCILHSKEANKDRGTFYERVGEKLRARDYNFAGAVFPGDLDFSGKEFVNANFREAEFRGRADFSGAVLGGATNFFLAKFREAAVFSRARLDGEARFSSVEFGGAAYFTRAVFGGSAVFFKARFGAEASFLEAEFHGPAHFVRGKFSGRTDFAGAEFRQVADFHWVSFSGETSFAQTVWGGNDTLTYGSRARPSFLGAASFFEANFGGKTYFAGNRLAGAVDFVRVQFAEAAFFTSRPLRPGVLPEPGEVGKEAAESAGERAELTAGMAAEGEERQAPAESKEEQAPELCFEEVFLEQPQQVRFDNFDLRRTTLAGTNLRHAGFHNCRWPRKRGRFAVYDEVKGRGGDPEALRLLYRDLRVNLEEAREVRTAGDFYYGEMELRRKARRRGRDLGRWLRRFFSPHTFYWLAGGYGERPLRAVLFFGFLVALFGWLFHQQSFLRVLEGQVVESPGWAACLGHSLRALTLQANFYLQPYSEWAHRLTLLARFVGPLQIVLIAVTLRRRLRR